MRRRWGRRCCGTTACARGRADMRGSCSTGARGTSGKPAACSTSAITRCSRTCVSPCTIRPAPVAPPSRMARRRPGARTRSSEKRSRWIRQCERTGGADGAARAGCLRQIGKRGGAAGLPRDHAFPPDDKEGTMKTWFALVGVVVVTGAAAWPKSGTVAGAAPGNVAVQTIPAGQRQAGHPAEKGATYYALEAQTTRLTTRFRDGHVAVTERGLIGDVRTTVRDQAGNERGRLRLNRIDDSHDTLNYEPSDGTPLQVLSDPNAVKPTLDWASRQAYGLAKDGTANLVWDNGTMRPRAAARRDLESEVSDVETVWANGLVAKVTRQTYSRRELSPGRAVEGPALVSELTLNGVPAGVGVWFVQDQVYAYHLPGLTNGLVFIAPEHL